MNKNLIFLVVGIFLLMGCTSDTDNSRYEAQLYSCETDTDCVPKPECHPRECINQAYSSDFESPELCTAMFDCNAAYTPENCACVDQQCVNKNIDADCSTERN